MNNDASERSIKMEEDVDVSSPSFSSLNNFVAMEQEHGNVSLSAHDVALARSTYQDLHVKHGKNKFRIQADVFNDSIGDIKKELEDITGVPANEQVLTYNGLGIKFADDKQVKIRCVL